MNLAAQVRNINQGITLRMTCDFFFLNGKCHLQVFENCFLLQNHRFRHRLIFYILDLTETMLYVLRGWVMYNTYLFYIHSDYI